MEEYRAQHPGKAEKRQELDELVEALNPRASVKDGLATALQPPEKLWYAGPSAYTESSSWNAYPASA